MARSLAERLRAHEQQKARLAQQEAKLKADERKARTRHLIQAGGLALKAGLLDLDPNALYGALLSLRDAARDPEQIRQWTALGGRAFAREARQTLEGREAIVLAFPTTLGRDATTALRGAGFCSRPPNRRRLFAPRASLEAPASLPRNRPPEGTNSRRAPVLQNTACAGC
jgi:Conjugal transfer protein TraD